MAIVRMKRLRLLAMRDDRAAILDRMQRMGCVQIEEPDAALPLPAPDGAQLSAARAEQQELRRALELLGRYAPAKEGLFRKRPAVSSGDFFDAEAYRAALEDADCILDSERELQRILSERGKCEALRASLQPWLAMETPLDVASTEAVCLEFGTLPAKGEAVAAPNELSALTEISADREHRYCRFVCHRSVREEALDALRAMGWSRVSFSLHGTAAENDARLAGEIEALEQRAAQQPQALAELGSSREELRRALDRATVAVQRSEAEGRLRDTQKTFCLTGWAEEARAEELREALSTWPCAIDLSEPEEAEYGDVPVRLKNNALTRPLSMVTEMYSLPRYGTVDPNPLTAPFFILFYGMMMADMGYGLLMFLAGLIVTRKYRPKGTSGHLFGLLELCGVSTFVFGALTGGFFGDFIPQLLKLINPASTFELPHLFTPMEDTTAILVGSMCLGAVQILTGMAVSVVAKCRSGRYLDALWNEGTWWVIFAGIALLVLKITPVVLYVGLAMLLVGAGWDKKGFGKVTAIFSSVYSNVTGYFGDVLSYSRLMALMLSGSVLAQVFNMLGAGLGSIPLFILVSMVGNAINFALNLLGCYVHDMRLQCLEYFGKFYVDGGRPFRPLAYDTKYVDIE